MVITGERFDLKTNISKNLGFPREFDNLTALKSEFILKEERFMIPSLIQHSNICFIHFQ